jgi:hypothetical protein
VNSLGSPSTKAFGLALLGGLTGAVIELATVLTIGPGLWNGGLLLAVADAALLATPAAIGLICGALTVPIRTLSLTAPAHLLATDCVEPGSPPVDALVRAGLCESSTSSYRSEMSRTIGGQRPSGPGGPNVPTGKRSGRNTAGKHTEESGYAAGGVRATPRPPGRSPSTGRGCGRVAGLGHHHAVCQRGRGRGRGQQQALPAVAADDEPRRTEAVAGFGGRP